METTIILIIALAIDLTLGEFPGALHPVVWMGHIITLELKLAPGTGRRVQFIYGTSITLLTIALFFAASYFLMVYLHALNTILYILVAAVLLKSSFAIKELRAVAIRIKGLLQDTNLSQARRETRALVKRDTTQLDEAHVVSATVESIAENTADSVVAPLFYFLFLGVPGALAYRVVNTFDARVGYHGEFEYLGKFAAWLDTVLNFIPSRLSGLLLVAAAYLYRQDGNSAWQVMQRDHARTESPNAGWPMSAMAGALNVKLEKIGYYALGGGGTPLSVNVIPRGIRLVDIAVLIWATFCIAMEVILFAIAT